MQDDGVNKLSCNNDKKVEAGYTIRIVERISYILRATERQPTIKNCYQMCLIERRCQ